MKIEGELGEEDGGKEKERRHEGSWFFCRLDGPRLGSARLGSPQSVLAAAPRQFVEIRSDSFYVCHAARRDPLPCVRNASAHSATTYISVRSGCSRFVDDSFSRPPEDA